MTAPAERATGTAAPAYDECRSCGRRWTLPRTGCPGCGTPDPHRRASAGRGRVAAVSVVHPPSGELYVLVLVDLDEGARVMARAAIGVLVDDRVQAVSLDGVLTCVGEGRPGRPAGRPAPPAASSPRFS